MTWSLATLRVAGRPAALTQCPPEMGRLPVTEKQQAECTIESDVSVVR